MGTSLGSSQNQGGALKEVTFGQLLHHFRLRARLTIVELAEAVGADRKSAALRERDRRVPRDRARLVDLAEALGLSSREVDQLTEAWRQGRKVGDSAQVQADTLEDSNRQARVVSINAPRYQLRPPVADFVGRAQDGDQLLLSMAMRKLIQASITFAQAMALYRTIGDSWGEEKCQWQIGLALMHHGKREQALPLLRAAVAYQQEIGHAKAAEHTALLVRLEAGEGLPAELLHPGQPAVGANEDAPPATAQP